MNRVIIALAALSVASVALANPVPVTNTTKAPYRAGKIYCNNAVTKPSRGENIACYNHDACYSDPQGRNRADCDKGYLKDMRRAGLGKIGRIKYQALRVWGKASWQRARKHDKQQAAQ